RRRPSSAGGADVGGDATRERPSASAHTSAKGRKRAAAPRFFTRTEYHVLPAESLDRRRPTFGL
ncbi:MAG TPA: hypothetical protein VIH73_01555, partial [Acidimicrobiales bacterium]